MVEKLHHVHRGREVLCLHHGVILCAGFRINQQQSVCTQTETWEGREESKVHLTYLVLAGDELIRCLTCNRCQTRRCEDDVHRNAGHDDHRQHET